MADLDEVIEDIRQSGKDIGFRTVAEIVHISPSRLSDIMAKRRPLPDHIAEMLGWEKAPDSWTKIRPKPYRAKPNAQ